MNPFPKGTLAHDMEELKIALRQFFAPAYDLVASIMQKLRLIP